MQTKKMICAILTCAFLLGTAWMPVNVQAAEVTLRENEMTSIVDTRASGSFSMTISAKTKSLAENSFRLVTGETVTIKASYMPFEASVDFGLVDEDGTFFSFKGTEGSVDKTIRIEESGYYTLQIRNNSDYEVEVSGFVNY